MAEGPILDRGLQKCFRAALEQAREMRHEYVTLEHVLLALLDDPKVKEALKACGADLKRLRARIEAFLHESMEQLPEGVEDPPQQTMALGRVIQRAAVHVVTTDRSVVDAVEILVSIFREEDSHARHFLEEEGVQRFALIRFISHGATKDPSDEIPERGFERADGDPDADEAPLPKDPLAAYTTNLNEEAAAGRIDPLVGREREMDRMIQVLCRRRKNNPLLVGEPGVGKTAIAHGLALAIHEKRVPKVLAEATIFSLDMGSLLAGTKFRGQFEERVKAVVKALLDHPNAIMFVDEIHTVVGAGATTGGTMDASNLLKPVLGAGRLRCIGSTTFHEYKASFERDRALARRFQRIEIEEPSIDETIEILKGLRARYEEHHGVVYEAGALDAAAKLAAKHLTDRLLPDKAIDVVDEAGAMDRMRAEPTGHVTVADIEKVVARMARIPERSVSAKDRDKLATLETDLGAVIFGQDDAIRSIAAAIKLSRSGLRTPEKPIGSFLFSGPTGVGKTELAKQLARVLGVEFLRYDMSEYSERHTVSRLIGAPPGYVGFDQGGLLTDSVRRNPYSVVVLDEIEKAHPDLFNILLQVMDHATLTDNNGRKADFRNVIMILTTNAGARETTEAVVGFGARDKGVPDESRAKSAIERAFSPEFRNRLDGWVRFVALSPAVVRKVVDKEIGLLQEQLDEKGVKIELTDAARAWLAEHGYDAAFGARPLSRLVEEKVKKPLAEKILFGSLKDGGTAKVDVVDGEIVVG